MAMHVLKWKECLNILLKARSIQSGNKALCKNKTIRVCFKHTHTHTSERMSVGVRGGQTSICLAPGRKQK